MFRSWEDKSRHFASSQKAVKETTIKPKTLSPACTYERDNRSDILAPLLKHPHRMRFDGAKSIHFYQSSGENTAVFPTLLF